MYIGLGKLLGFFFISVNILKTDFFLFIYVTFVKDVKLFRFS